MVLFRKKIWPRRELSAFGYREVDRAGFSWLANEEGAWFLMGVDDWSPQALSGKKGWHFWQRQYHSLYLAEDQSKRRYLIKVYPPKKNRAGFFARKANRAKKEFFNTLRAHQKGIKTVLPLAAGEAKQDSERGAIVYPYLEEAISVGRVYPPQGREELTVRDRHLLERSLGRLIRDLTDRGIYPRDMGLDHFLLKREEGRLCLYAVDLERVKFTLWSSNRWALRILARFLAVLEWRRVSGGRISRSGIMRIAHGYFHRESLGRLNKELCLALIEEARKISFRRGWNVRPYPANAVEVT